MANLDLPSRRPAGQRCPCQEGLTDPERCRAAVPGEDLSVGKPDPEIKTPAVSRRDAAGAVISGSGGCPPGKPGKEGSVGQQADARGGPGFAVGAQSGNARRTCLNNGKNG
jgi:hypothetical protein